MGESLIVNILEMEYSTNPDFDKAKKWLDKMSNKEAENAIYDAIAYDDIIGYFGIDESLDDAYEQAISKARERLQSALDAVKEGWEGNRRNMVPIDGKYTRILIAGDSTWGDKEDKYGLS
jgi:hypothetical protein